MGWWKIASPESGQIDRDAVPTVGSLVNAIPGRSTPENYYNGDSPADIMDSAVFRITLAYEKLGRRTTRAMLEELLFGKPDAEGGRTLDPEVARLMEEYAQRVAELGFHEEHSKFVEHRRLALDNPELSVKVIAAQAWVLIVGDYQESWGRPPYPEERLAVFNFCVNNKFGEA